MSRLAVAATVLATVSAAEAGTIRVATFNVSLARSGPGLVYEDLGQTPLPDQIANLAGIIARVDPDILLVNELDYDGGGLALERFRSVLRAAGSDYAHSFVAPPNTGLDSGLDLDGDGERSGPGDAFGYGRFPGQYGMAVLSRFPIDPDESRAFAGLLWKDFPDALLPVDETGAPFPSAEAQSVMRLSSKSHWDVAVRTPDGVLRLLASHPTPPVFDGREDLNGKRNHDEILFWARYLDGVAFTDDAGRTAPFSGEPFVVLGDLNADPVDGDGRHAAIGALLAHPALTDPRPTSTGGREAAAQGGANDRHRGDPSLDTADWSDGPRGPGNLRVDYVLPARSLTVSGSGVFWPGAESPESALLGPAGAPTSDHRLVWVDVEF